MFFAPEMNDTGGPARLAPGLERLGAAAPVLVPVHPSPDRWTRAMADGDCWIFWWQFDFDFLAKLV